MRGRNTGLERTFHDYRRQLFLCTTQGVSPGAPSASAAGAIRIDRRNDEGVPHVWLANLGCRKEV